MTRRPRRGIPASLTGLVLLAVSVLTATDAIQMLVRRPPLISYATLTGRLHRLHWNGPVPAAVAGILALLGLVLLLTAILPGAPVVVALRPAAADKAGSPLPEACLSRRGLRAMLRSAAASVNGVTSAALTRRRNVISVSVHTPGSADGLAEAVRTALDQQLDRIAPAARPELRVKASTRSTS